MGFHGSKFPDFQIRMRFRPAGSSWNDEETPKSVGIPGVGWEEEKTANNPGLNSQKIPGTRRRLGRDFGGDLEPLRLDQEDDPKIHRRLSDPSRNREVQKEIPGISTQG